ncbi:MAG: hypothetical protein ACT6FC_02410 [Methanosarcinaceae archaeon]
MRESTDLGELIAALRILRGKSNPAVDGLERRSVDCLSEILSRRHSTKSLNLQENKKK